MNTYTIEAGIIVDKWNANSENEALDLFARDAGYKNYQALIKEHGKVDSIYKSKIVKEDS